MKIVKVALGGLIAFAFSVTLVGGGASSSPWSRPAPSRTRRPC